MEGIGGKVEIIKSDGIIEVCNVRCHGGDQVVEQAGIVRIDNGDGLAHQWAGQQQMGKDQGDGVFHWYIG